VLQRLACELIGSHSNSWEALHNVLQRRRLHDMSRSVARDPAVHAKLTEKGSRVVQQILLQRYMDRQREYMLEQQRQVSCTPAPQHMHDA
jgi:hypothetical protein